MASSFPAVEAAEPIAPVLRDQHQRRCRQKRHRGVVSPASPRAVVAIVLSLVTSASRAFVAPPPPPPPPALLPLRAFCRVVGCVASRTCIAASGMKEAEAEASEGVAGKAKAKAEANGGNSLGASVMRSIVLRAARKDARASGLSLEGIAWLEHVNLVVGSAAMAEAFYQHFLGCTRDPHATFHVNLGQQQFHLAEAKARSDDGGGEEKERPQRVTGSIGLVVPDLSTVRSRVDSAETKLGRGATRFAVLDDNADEGYMTLSCPWGNTMHLYCQKADDARSAQSSAPSTFASSPQKMTKLHSDGGAYSYRRMAIRGQPGIRFVEIAVAPGTVPSIRDFYKNVLGCTCHSISLDEHRRLKPHADNDCDDDDNNDADAVAVSVGPNVHLVFVECPTLTERDRLDMKGVHICVYASQNFRSLYHRLKDRSLIWTNPRFVHLDTCDTWDEAERSRTLRFRHIVAMGDSDTTSGDGTQEEAEMAAKAEVELEHETRPLRHGQYLKVPYYVPK